MKAFKLFKQRRDGSLGPLFINARQRVPVGPWLQAEAHKRKGFAFRPGWHCALSVDGAPHLQKQTKSGPARVWAEVEVRDFTTYERPGNQGGSWVLANEMRVVRVLG